MVQSSPHLSIPADDKRLAKNNNSFQVQRNVSMNYETESLTKSVTLNPTKMQTFEKNSIV